MIHLIIECWTVFFVIWQFEPQLHNIMRSYCSYLKNILKIRSYFLHFDMMCSFCFLRCCNLCCLCYCYCCCYCFWCCCYYCHFYLSVAISVAVAVGYFHCRKKAVIILCTATNFNMFASVSVTTVNVTKYVIILIFDILGVGGGGSGWYIWRTTFIMTLLITFTINPVNGFFWSLAWEN